MTEKRPRAWRPDARRPIAIIASVADSLQLIDEYHPNHDVLSATPPTPVISMRPPLPRLSISSRRKLMSILPAVAIYASLTVLTTSVLGRPVINGLLNAIIVCTGVGLFEEFYVQTPRGRWLRSMQPLKSILLYTLVVVALFLLSILLSRLILWDWASLSWIYRHFPELLPIVITFSVVGIVVMRVAHFIGIETLFHLMVGTYHRPVVEKKVLMFLDINDSTSLATRLGAIEMKSFLGKFLFDISAPITNNGGDIYLYKGDGLIALWAWEEAVSRGKILQAIDAVFATVQQERAAYLDQFGVLPAFRIGVHGGEIVVSEQGDTKRSIGIYGNTINIAARMEEAAKVHGVSCVISGDVAQALSGSLARLAPIGCERVRGIETEIPIFEYRTPGAAAQPAEVSVRQPMALAQKS
jgi:adenylate cyclase